MSDEPHGYRGLSRALDAQPTTTGQEPLPYERRPRRGMQHFKTHWYCAACLKRWDMDVKQLHLTQEIPPATRAEHKCEECGSKDKCWLIHETEEVTRLKQGSQSPNLPCNLPPLSLEP